jgi:hypothetical protein
MLHKSLLNLEHASWKEFVLKLIYYSCYKAYTFVSLSFDLTVRTLFHFGRFSHNLRSSAISISMKTLEMGARDGWDVFF